MCMVSGKTVAPGGRQRGTGFAWCVTEAKKQEGSTVQILLVNDWPIGIQNPEWHFIRTHLLDHWVLGDRCAFDSLFHCQLSL